MDIYIDRDELSRGLARVQGIIERRSTHPILSHVLLHAKEESLRITATDTEVAYIGDLSATVEKQGQLAVDAASLFQVVRAMPESTIQLKLGASNRLEISSGRSNFKLPGTPAEDYPPLPAFDSRGTVQLKEIDLRRMIEQTSFAVATDDVRYGLNGAHMEKQEFEGKSFLRMVSTDGHRLSLAQAPFEGELVLTPRMLVPRKALAVMKKLLDTSDESVELSFGEAAIRLSRPNQTFWFRLLDGEFPDYDAVVPNESKHTAQFRRVDLGSTLKRVGILVQDRARAVRFSFEENQLEIQLNNVDRGEVLESIPMELEGETVTVGFNIRYLQDILGVVDGDTVSLNFAHPLAPCLIKSTEHSNSLFVVMPMRLD